MNEDPDMMEKFMMAMSGGNNLSFQSLARQLDFSNVKVHCDIGGSAGDCCIQLAKVHSHIKGITWDLPKVSVVTQKYIAKSGLSDRISIASGDFFVDEFPKADLITMGCILHDWDEKNKLMLMKKAFNALPEGGMFVAVEWVVDDARKNNLMGLSMSLNMLIEFGADGGFDYSLSEFDSWAKQVGFKSTKALQLVVGVTGGLVAFK